MPAADEYQTIVPGQRHFQCVSLHALLDTRSCADRWVRAMQPDSEKLITCRRCPIGRQHHAEHHPDEPAAHLQPVRAPVCVRCGRPATRMVSNEICPSCFNRFREFLKGRNGRGSAPVNYRPPLPRRVGVLDNRGIPAWAFFDGQHHQEAMARATRAGWHLSNAQPGCSVWNVEAERFEYTDPSGRVLVEMELDGLIEYVGVTQLHTGEKPALVIMPTMLMDSKDAAVWLTVSGEGGELGVDLHQIEFGCVKCRQGMLLARRTQSGIRVQCSAGCS